MERVLLAVRHDLPALGQVGDDRLTIARVAADQQVVHGRLGTDVGDGAGLVNVEVHGGRVHAVAQRAAALGGGIRLEARVLRRGELGRRQVPAHDDAGADRAGSFEKGSTVLGPLAHDASPRSTLAAASRGLRGFRTIAEVGAKCYRTVSSSRTRRAPSASARSFPSARSRGRYFIPQSGAGISRSAGTWASAARMRPSTAARATPCSRASAGPPRWRRGWLGSARAPAGTSSRWASCP